MPPEGHPITVERAKELMKGPLPHIYESVALSCSAPLLWFRREGTKGQILHTGTLTIIRTTDRLLGITAAHVIEQYWRDAAAGGVTLQIQNEVVEELKVLDSSLKQDLATIQLDNQLIEKLGNPLGDWPPRRAVEGRGLLMAGYPASGKTLAAPWIIDWAPFFCVTVARRVTDGQISVMIPRDAETCVKNDLPHNCHLGGISGGPIIGIFETPNYVAWHCLAGVITQHPDYAGSDFSIERIVGTCAEVITERGTIR